MRTPIAFATFLGLGAVAVGVGATPQVMKGSDTLFDLLTDGNGVLLNCVVNGTPLSPSPATGSSLINYVGTGSGNGENEMEQSAAPAQHVAPMSSFLSKNTASNNICAVKETGTSATTAEGIDFALDGIVIEASKTSGGSSTCSGNTAIDNTGVCDPGTANAGLGLAYAVVIHDVEKIVPGPNNVLETIKNGTDILVGGTQNNGTTLKPGLERILAAGPGLHVQSTPAGDDVVLPEVTYTIPAGASGWKDILKVIYGGVDNVSGTKSCASAIRYAVADTYSNVFQSGCSTTDTSSTGTTATSGNGCRQKTCTGATTSCTTIGDGPAELRHAFRRDDASGTTDTFLSILGLTKPKSVQDAACVSGFCNGFTGTAPPEDWRTDNVISDDQGTANATKAGAYDWDYQDFDPIRRRCMDKDDVCDRRGTLGLVLAIVPTDFLTKSQAFSLTADTNGKAIPGTSAASMLGTAQASTIPVYHSCSGTTSVVDGRCPNGVTQQTGCQWPNTGDSNTPAPLGAGFNNYASNYNGKDNTPTEAPVNDVVYAGWKVGAADGRAYNKIARDLGAAPTNLLVDKKIIGTQPRKIVGAFYRLHAASEGLGSAQELPGTGGTPLCNERDATSQIACLTANDPCAIGYAGRGTLSNGFNTAAIRINQQAPTDDCVQRLLSSPTTAYPLARRLFLSSIVGFQNLFVAGADGGNTGKGNVNELALAQCMSNPAMMRTIITGHDFVPNGAGPTTGPDGGTVRSDQAVCYDFNENGTGQCATGSNSDACVGNDTVPVVSNCPNCTSIPGSTAHTLP
jgi:hypothetical protein